MTRYAKSEVESARERLSELLKPGNTVYCILRHVSRSGMSRDITLYYIDGEGTTHWLDYSAAVLLGYPLAKDQGIRVSGCGMDMGFHLVYSLGSALFPDGFTCTGKPYKCPSNDHFNGDRDYTPHTHRDGGYALKCKWL